MSVKIPFYKEVVVSSFCCPHCGFENTSTMEGEQIQEKGVEFQLHVKDAKVIFSKLKKNFLKDFDLWVTLE